jgi:hypothetical protein
MRTFLLFSVFTILLQKNANSCTCFGASSISESIKESFKESNLIIKGDVLAVKDFSINPIFAGFKVFTISIENIYKGRYRKATIDVITGEGGGDCGYPFSIGEKYIIYTNFDSELSAKNNLTLKSYYTDICTRTTPSNLNEIEVIKKYKRKHIFWWL